MRFLDTARCKIWVDRNLFVKVTGNLASFHWKGFKFNLHLLTKRMENGKSPPTHKRGSLTFLEGIGRSQSVSQCILVLGRIVVGGKIPKVR
jgi:predicted alpha/beta-hydrolase family hydrolase